MLENLAGTDGGDDDDDDGGEKKKDGFTATVEKKISELL